MAKYGLVDGDNPPTPLPTPVEHDPFAPDAPRAVEHDPFAQDSVDHRTFVDRWEHGNAMQKVMAAGAKGMQEGFGPDDPRSIGFTERSQNTRWMQQLGVFADPENPQLVDGLRLPIEGAIRLTAGVGDAALRLVNGTIHAGGSMLGAAGEESGLMSQGQANRLKNEAINFANYTMIKEANSPAPFERVIKGKDGMVRSEPIGAIPEAHEFESTARSILRPQHNTERAGERADHTLAENAERDRREKAGLTFHPEPFKEAGAERRAGEVDQVSDKVRSLYEEYGIHPNEVLAAARNDADVMRSLASDSPLLPEHFTGLDLKKPEVKQLEGVSPELSEALAPRQTWPETPEIVPGMPPEPKRPLFTRLGQHVSSLIDRAPVGVQSIIRDLQMKATPMAERMTGMNQRAAAKDFANTRRAVIDEGQIIHERLTKEFTPDRMKAMFEAVDAEDAAKMAGGKVAEGKGLASLEPRERAVVEELRNRMRESYIEAGELKMHRDQGGGKEFYVPRMIEAARTTTRPRGAAGEGANLTTTTTQLRRRKYATAAETEAAAQKALGEDAFLVRDIRTLNLANMRLQEAIQGRKLIDEVKKLNKDIDEPAVIEGAVPEHKKDKYFTLDHPAFRQLAPALKRGEDGRWMRAKYDDGTPAFKSEPTNVHRDFEGPLKAVLTMPEGAAYRGYMDLKARSMSALMYSPLKHNMVIFGRAMPAGKMADAPAIINKIPGLANTAAVARYYFDGNKVRGDLALRREAIEQGGLVPQGARGAFFDVSSIAGTRPMEIGQSYTARVLSAIPDYFSPSAGKAVKEGVDAAGKLVHEQLLWDRVADLQFGLWKNFRDELMEKKGFDQLTANRVAGHFANRYAGAIPHEAVSQGMRQILNVGLFSRSYTMTGIGALKDLITGLPRDVLAQIERDGGVQMLDKARSVAQKKALGIVAMDFALFYVGNSLLQSGLSALRKSWESDESEPPAVTNEGFDVNAAMAMGGRVSKEKMATAVDEEMQGYLDRAHRLVNEYKEFPNGPHPFHVFHPWTQLGSNADNEPGKTDRILTGYQSDGTAIYAKNPFGKTTEDMAGWLTQPAQMIINKSNPVGVRPLIDSFWNRDYADHHIYNPNAELPEKLTRSMANIVWHTLSAAVPADEGASALELLAGTPSKDEANMDTLKIVGGILGFSFSKGYPGGPFMGEVAMSQKEYQYALETTLPQARKLAKEDRIDEARELMEKAKIPDRFQSYVIDMARDPSAKFAKRRTQQFIQTLPQEKQDEIQRAIDRMPK